ncbi:MAG: MerR family DNA-binding protein [Luteitalea sp.]|nr:MerR family DNA-binding protein [Luteitalea sp.]
MSTSRLLIGDVAQRTGISTPTIRYYESIGLLPAPSRSTTDYRRYTEATVEELQFIKKAQAFGFSLEESGAILQLSRAGETPCSHVLELARRHVAAVDERIHRLTRFRDQLASAIAKWDGTREPTCRGLCQIIVNADEQPSIRIRPVPAPKRQPTHPRKTDRDRRG